jgi:hypothetical protein
LNNAKDNINRV